MIADIPAEEVLWLSRFFSGRNELRWQQIVDQTAPRHWLATVMPWLSFVAAPRLVRPIVLPCFAGNQIAAWYAIAPDAEVASQMLEEIKAFVGPSFSQFTGQWHVPTLEDDVEASLRERFGTSVVCLLPNGPDDLSNLERSIASYQRILARRPAVVDRTVRPFGEIRGDFDRALLAGNQARSQRFLDELVATGRVNAEQRKCLEIRLLAGLGRQSEIANNRSLLESVMNLGLPPQTIVDVVEALYAIQIASIENDRDVAMILNHFKRTIAQPFAPLFRERKGIRRPRVLRSFLLYEAVQTDPNEARCDAILDAYPNNDDGHELIVRWRRSLSLKSSGTTIDQVRQAILDEDYEIAARGCLAALPQPWAYKALLRAAIEIPSPDLRRRVRQVFDEAEQKVLDELAEKDRNRLSRITNSVAEDVSEKFDADWIAWARWVVSGAHQTAPMPVLEAAAINWNPDEFAQNGTRCVELAKLIGNASGDAEQVFREAFPALVEFFVDRPSRAYRTFAPVYSVLISVIALSGPASSDELEIATSVTRALFEVGPTEQMYVDCLTDLGEILATNSAPIHLDWALSVAELLSLYPCPHIELRMRTFISVVELCRTNRHRLTGAQRSVLEMLSADYGCPELINSIQLSEATTATRAEAAFAGLIGIYTLNESAGGRARRALETLLPMATVEVNGDVVSTVRLRSLARNADLFVFAWRTSTHQAYYCAKEARGDRDMILPPGGGTASLVRSVVDAISS